MRLNLVVCDSKALLYQLNICHNYYYISLHSTALDMAKWLHVITEHYHYIQIRQLVHFNTAKSSHRLETGLHSLRPRNWNHGGHSLAYWTWHCLMLWLSLGYFSHLNLYGYGYYTEHLTISWFLYHHNSTIDRQCGQCFSFHRCVSIYLVMAHSQSHLTLAPMHFF